MASIVTDYLPLEIKSNPYYAHAKRGYLSHLLLDAAKAGHDVYENEYNKLNNLTCARKENNHITIQDVFKDNWGYFVEYCNRKNIPLREAILTNVDSMINCRNFNNKRIFEMIEKIIINDAL